MTLTASRIVVKAGTSVVMRDDGYPALGCICAMSESIATLQRSGRHVILVSSGAVGLGAQRSFGGHAITSSVKQASAAIGQGLLAAIYADAFDRLGVLSAQVLVTAEDFRVEERLCNLRSTLATLMDNGVVPIMNENDATTSYAKERNATMFTNNDELASLLAREMRAQLLILLSDVDGLYDASPVTNPGAELLRSVSTVTDGMIAAAQGKGAFGRGGMSAKLGAVRSAMDAGVSCVIANGRLPAIIDRICSGERVGTYFALGES